MNKKIFIYLLFIVFSFLNTQNIKNNQSDIKVTLVGVTKFKNNELNNEIDKKQIKKNIYDIFNLFKEKSKIPELNISFYLDNFASTEKLFNRNNYHTQQNQSYKNIVYLQAIIKIYSNNLYFYPFDTLDMTIKEIRPINALIDTNMIYSLLIIEPLNPQSLLISNILLSNILNNNSILINTNTENKFSFYKVLADFYTNKQFLDNQKGKNYNTFGELINHFKYKNYFFYGDDKVADTNKLISYKWVPEKIQTNLVYIDEYEIIIELEKTDIYTRNFITYKKIRPQREIKKKTGKKQVEQVITIEGYWK